MHGGTRAKRDETNANSNAEQTDSNARKKTSSKRESRCGTSAPFVGGTRHFCEADFRACRGGRDFNGPAERTASEGPRDREARQRASRRGSRRARWRATRTTHNLKAFESRDGVAGPVSGKLEGGGGYVVPFRSAWARSHDSRRAALGEG